MAKTAIDIERLVVWALVTQAVRVESSEGGERVHRLISNTGAVENFLAIGGVRIQGGGANDRRTPDDALTVAAAIERLPVMASALIVSGARSGIGVSWAEEGVGRYEPVIVKGKHRRLYEDQRQARGLKGFEWKWVGLYPDQVDHERLQYVAWIEALKQLRDDLEGRLSQWVAIGPSRAEEPWNEPARRVLHSV